MLSFGCIPAAASASYILYFSDIAITVAKKVSYVEEPKIDTYPF